ncbi:MAG: phospholipase D family protein [Pseudomonadota bacterium]|nr:phospholipase D family protein [Pseudomonadota bacterium]
MKPTVHQPERSPRRFQSPAALRPSRPGDVSRILNRQSCNRVLFAIVVLLSLGGCASLPEDVERPTSYAYPDTDDTRLGQSRRDEIRRHSGESGFLLLGNGLDAFVARAVLANAAERSIDAQYYLLHNDLTGRLFIDQLIRAADRGVRVRLLVDDMDLEGRTLGAAVLDSHPNVEVRLFNPFSRNAGRVVQLVTRFGSVTRRMHNKSFTVDNQAAILGGRNIGDEYFGADPEVAFTDLDVLVIGPVVKEVSESFDSYWNSELAYPATALLGGVPTAEETRQKRRELEEFVAEQTDSAYLRALRDSDLANQIRANNVQFEWGDAHVVQDEPEKLLADRSERSYHLAPQLEPYFRGVRDELYVFSPYFVPGKSGTAFLSDLSRRGVRVRVLTNSLASTDVPVVHSGYAKYRKDLLRAGVELYEMKSRPGEGKKRGGSGFAGSSKASLHTKAFIFDRKHIFIGSLNLDPRSVHENTEIGVVLTSPEVGSRIGPALDEAIDRVAFRLALETDQQGNEKIVWHEEGGGEGQTYSVDPHTSFWQRFGVGFMGLLPVESQL